MQRHSAVRVVCRHLVTHFRPFVNFLPSAWWGPVGLQRRIPGWQRLRRPEGQLLFTYPFLLWLSKMK
ncbi:hypothetical protein [Hymenobacter sp. GOD-10R]|uniref:hypothetical protein n=1 Tax=Hymenobacter sp. GOD-10R TaxID=3093922 RepID=UPI002D779038|nr:hypothetical protein [Hymenobacter sp. GOD-10R]WRQ31539.1 hypothetical protein SD425_27065 [Hymenobacter sp. GOD-10R]